MDKKIHSCHDRCKTILAEHYSGVAFKPVWNSLTYLEQADWKSQVHLSWIQRLLAQVKGWFV